ncbi:MAG: hypothetical protein FJ279_33995 [Planctomycetes bacterium]|nr:hypothetical protein [Planctomycetota bacterium]
MESGEKCQTCGAPLAAESAFCHKCGAKVVAESAAAPAPAQPAAAYGQVEMDLWSGRPSPWAMGLRLLGMAALALVFLCAFVAAWWKAVPHLPILGYALLAFYALLALWTLAKLVNLRYGKRYHLTSQRLTVSEGILSTRQDEMELIRVDDVAVQQTVWDRVFGVGTVEVVSTDASHPKLVIAGILSPHDVKEKIREHVQRRRAKTMFVERV